MKSGPSIWVGKCVFSFLLFLVVVVVVLFSPSCRAEKSIRMFEKFVFLSFHF